VNRAVDLPIGECNGAAALVGAILGGLAGMRFHRKVDKVGLGL
jgi:uncharacterized membrane protein YfcA